MTNQQPLVSIIIPTYNRAHLIGETLDSIIAQTYQNWECIVTDDGSTDDTDTVMAMYVANDSRFKYFHRPAGKPKGANACRNNGLDKSLGDYIIFFDSDDLMTEDHIEVKLQAILQYQTDFIITKTKNLNGKSYPHHYYNFDNVSLNQYNYISQNINWLTLDILIKKEVIQNIRFNENLQSGQEYNFFSKLISKTTSYHFVSSYVSLRREHINSIRKKLDNENKLINSKFLTEIETFHELKNDLSSKSKKYLLISAVKLVYKSPIIVKGYRHFINIQLYKAIGFKFIYFEIMLLLSKVNKAYRMRNMLIKSLEQSS